MDQQSIPVRTALMPLCYRDFRCLAGDCRDNCCGGWEIAFNKKDYLHIKRSAQSQELKEILAEGMSRLRDQAFDGNYAHFNVGTEGRCRFQTEEGLCRLQLECGEEALPYVCRIYPRKSVYTPAARELSLSPSCEGVLALLWDQPQGIDFLEEPLPKQDWRKVDISPPWARFADIRSLCIDVLQERSLPLSRRMLLLGFLLQKLKDTDWAEAERADAWLAWAEAQLRSPLTAAALEQTPRDELGFLTGNIRVLLELYQTEKPAAALCRELFSALSAEEDWEKEGLERFSIDCSRYRALEGRLEELLGHSEYFFENLMVITAFYLSFPKLSDPEALWKSYVELCSLYSFFRFVSVCGCRAEVGRERLFHVLSVISRGLLHNAGRRTELVNELLAGGGTLAHMAILLGG